MVNEDFSALETFDHVIVLMLENRSFDNLLGYLYKDENFPAGKKFDGLQEGYSNKIPEAYRTGDAQAVAVSRAASYHQPYPDPGEEYPHINTQLYNQIKPASNTGIYAINMKSPYNLDESLPASAPMSGFVKDYINTLTAVGVKDTTYRIPSYEQFSPIMQCFEPDQIQVMSKLATSFAVFDHWHCSVPSQTWCNRAFWHAGTSAGFVINPIEEDGETLGDEFKSAFKWVEHMWKLPTLFTRLKQGGISSKIYADNYIALTHLIHGFKQTSPAFDMDDFYADLAKPGQAEEAAADRELPQYSFIEPNFSGLGKPHNDQHPSAVNEESTPGTVLRGEKLIYEIYNAVRSSPLRDRILFIITHDEHGGCFDHVSPPSMGVVPPEENMPYQQEDFEFDRLGVRVPMIMMSSHIAAQTIVQDVFDHTSFLHTMREKWQFEHLTNRDSNAASFKAVFNQPEAREWPELPPINWPPEPLVLEFEQHPLNHLQKAILKVAAAYAMRKDRSKADALGLTLATVKRVKTVGDAMAILKKAKAILYDS